MFSEEDFLRLDAGHFRAAFDQGTLTVAALISRTIRQIEQRNQNGLALNALISLVPESVLRDRADILDLELRSGHSRGLLHGIPVVLKDCIATVPELGTTTSAGSFALLEDKITKNAPLVDRSLGGSSTGSAISVSAGFSLIGIGTENDGSVVQPSSRQGLYSLKLSRDITSAEGYWRVSKSLDTPRAMARSARDVAAASEILLNPDALSRLPEGSYASFCTQSFEGLKIGFNAAYHHARNEMHSRGAKVAYPVTLPLPSELNIGNDYALFIVNLFESAAVTQEFFDNYIDNESLIRNLRGLVDFNKAHPEKCLPQDQSWLVKAVGEKPLPEKHREAFDRMLRVGRDGLVRTLQENDIDAVISPMDSPACSLGTASGYPMANVPLGRYHLKEELSRPFGLAVFAHPKQEEDIFRFISAYETSFLARPIPERLVHVVGSL
ncbi:amidase signature domain-containing protein [Podospora didyma]|uniref:Amidase signature domain-containing protein n=1 Tax=Podospora didyma TaxID=330526 RepID=A0AAE0NZB8_9PEZI|nr:amidase signature domain-containing protein [Podospora didyma]